MRTIHSIIIGAAALGLLGACKPAPAPVDTAKITDALKAAEAQWNADIKARDADKFASHYTDDATVINPYAPPVHGRAAVAAAMKPFFADPNFGLTFAADSVGVAPSGDLAYTQGHFTETESDAKTHAKVTNTGSYVTVYKPQADGSWKAVEDIASPDTPPKS
jgi:uncharacterized protein (TIGR02246 family)